MAFRRILIKKTLDLRDKNQERFVLLPVKRVWGSTTIPLNETGRHTYVSGVFGLDTNCLHQSLTAVSSYFLWKGNTYYRRGVTVLLLSLYAPFFIQNTCYKLLQFLCCILTGIAVYYNVIKKENICQNKL